jgi:hypothetical protein
MTIDAEQLMTIAATGIALKRTENDNGDNFCSDLRNNVGIPTKPLNPSPRNRNPIPGWNTGAEVTWPNAPAFWEDPSNLFGMVLVRASVNLNNNTQIVRGCTGDKNPVAVIQGTMTVDGTMDLWRDGGIPDPYEPFENFTAETASATFNIGVTTTPLVMRMDHILITTDAHDVQGQNTLTTRNFGFAGLGDGIEPPLVFEAA